jgi:4-hydroxy-4-methyl-2-oxoglutarate aldolase
VNADELARLTKLGVATVYEAAGRAGLIDLPLIQLLSGSRAAGPARTVFCGQDDNLMVHAAIERIQPGDMLVLTMPEPRPVALVGELLATQVKVRGAAAILVDAGVRDVEELRELGLPVWTRFIRVKGASKTVLGETDVPVVMGGTRIASGDIVVLDADGGVSIPSARAAEVLATAEARYEREAHLREKLLTGAMSYDLHGLRTYVEMNRRKQDAP